MTLAFAATPANAAGSVALKTVPKRPAKALTLPPARFTVPESGNVRLVVRVGKSLRRELERQKRSQVRATIELGGRTFTATFTLRAPKP